MHLFLKKLFGVYFNSLNMANIGVLPYRVLGRGPHPIASSDSEKKLNVSLRLRSPNNVAKGNLMSSSYLVQVVRKSALHV